ncbi:MAG TPA: SusC/RagA family TonB-linked outer membrane protein [Balneolales bacterium]|nr:SusC/RagA family TonB-linked outer membrane protein [Balneolales bacterium]
MKTRLHYITTTLLAMSLMGVVSTQAISQGAYKNYTPLSWYANQGALQPSYVHAVSLDVHNMSLVNVIQMIAMKGNVRLTYNKSLLPKNRRVSLNLKKSSVVDAINKALDNTGLMAYASPSGQIVFISAPEKKKENLGQYVIQHTVTGTVTDGQTGEALPGVNVLVKGTSTGTATDPKGHYSLDASSATDTLVFSYIGYVTQTIPIDGQSTINVKLQQRAISGKELVVTAFGIQRQKRSLGYAVTQVSSEDVSTVKQTNIVNSLEGRVPGVVITQSAAGPGSGTRVIIRGNNSLTGNNQPLYVVDGVPIDNAGFGSSAGSGTGEYSRTDYGTGISDINPDDIASITVLKGPNAAALYGSRASNGVILITTKKGRANHGLGVSYSSNFTVETPMVLPKFQNIYGQGDQGNTYNNLSNLLNYGGSWGAKMDGSNQLAWTGKTVPYTAQPNNVKDFFRTGGTIINTLALEGGNNKATLRASYTNTNANAIVPNSGLSKQDFDIRATANLTDKLSVDSKVTYFYQQDKHRITQGTEGIMAYLYTIPRNLNISDLQNYQKPDGSVNSWSNGNGNPYWVVDHDINSSYRNRVNGFLKVNYNFTPYLSAFVRVGTDQVNQKTETVYQPGHWFYQTGQFAYATYKTGETNADFLVTFNKGLTDKFHADVFVGGNYRLDTYPGQNPPAEWYVNGQDFKIPTKATIASASILSTSYTPTELKRVTSLYGSAEFSYNDMVYLDLTGRNDWSSTLPQNNWSYFYPSASLSVMLNRFVDPNHKILDSWKVRGSWARVGNDTDPYQLTNAFNLSATTDSYLGLPILTRPSVLNNVNLKPEQVTSTEVGTEARFFENRLHFDLSLYSILSDNLIMDVPISQSTGYSQFHTNVGQISNRGIEITLGGMPVMSSNFNWDISVNFAHNQNKLDRLIKGLDNYIFTTTNSGTVTVQATAGGGYGDIMGTTWMRSPDGQIVVDNTGRPLATSDKVHLGNYQPNWTGGLSNSFSYKSFNLRVLVDARFGGQLYSGTGAQMDAAGVSAKSLQYRSSGIVVNGVVNTGTAASPKYVKNTKKISAEEYWGAYSGIASNYIYDQTNVRLREASLTYSLPKRLLNHTPLTDVTVGLVGRNLFFFYKKSPNFDPESSFSTSNFAQGVLFDNLPTTRQVGLDINIKF